MKKLLYPLLFASAFFAFYEQSKSHPNKILMFLSIGIFMIGLMKLMSKVPSRSEPENDNFDVNNESKAKN